MSPSAQDAQTIGCIILSYPRWGRWASRHRLAIGRWSPEIASPGIPDMPSPARVAVFALLAVQVVMMQAPLGAAALAGTVSDRSGLVVAGAEVILTENSKGLERRATSGDSGSFLFPS